MAAFRCTLAALYAVPSSCSSWVVTCMLRMLTPLAPLPPLGQPSQWLLLVHLAARMHRLFAWGLVPNRTFRLVPQVLSFAGELLANAETLLRDGLHPTEIADGYARAGARALEILDTLVVPSKGEPAARRGGPNLPCSQLSALGAAAARGIALALPTRWSCGAQGTARELPWSAHRAIYPLLSSPR